MNCNLHLWKTDFVSYYWIMSENGKAAATGPLNWLFVDMNSYFASVEQQMRPELRGRPVAVAPVVAETTCAIAASYEARRFGIKTGTNIAEARRLCPGLEVVQARPAVYVETHHEIVAAVDSVLPIDKVNSIDEMYCRLGRSQQGPEEAVPVAQEVKRAIRERVGEFIPCSVGLAPNAFLAKVASELQKPDGLSVVLPEELPHKLYPLALRDLPGIGRRMEARLRREGVLTVEQLCALSKSRMREIWNGVVGERWWHALRGDDLPSPPTQRRTVGHSHVLSPEFRTHEGAQAVLVKLVHKAAARLRRLGYHAGAMTVGLSYFDRKKWRSGTSLGPCQDTQTLLRILFKLWEERPAGRVPVGVSVTLHDLVPDVSMSLPLFPEDRRRLELTRAMDAANARYGANAVYLAAMHRSLETAPMRIAFTQIPDVAAESDGRVEPLTPDGSPDPLSPTDVSAEGDLPA